jgi:ribose transport system substrate-binding protein
VVAVVAVNSVSGCSTGVDRAASPAVRQALAADRTPPPLSAYRGPTGGPRAQAPAPIVFVAADLTDDDIATVARGVQQAAAAIGVARRAPCYR